VGRSLFERGYVHATAGNISVRLADGYLITPTDACLGTLQPERLARLDAQGQQVAGDRASKTIALHRRSTRPQHRQPPRALRDPHAQHAPGGLLAAADTAADALARAQCCPHHALLRHEGGPRAAHPLPPPRRCRRPRWWQTITRYAARAALCAP
jgi:hypothetical protein